MFYLRGAVIHPCPDIDGGSVEQALRSWGEDVSSHPIIYVYVVTYLFP